MIAIVIKLFDFGNQLKALRQPGHRMFVATDMVENPKIEGCPQRRRYGAVNAHR
ncbi:hypothetical protein ACCC97_01615 [Variovorax sp. Varisp85]|jgi:hypothetical protein|uniref:hypothetical protein n=1 Tax=Variovorax sp. Varisp85 TaxID=3243059 RepID=UPI0039A5C569